MCSRPVCIKNTCYLNGHFVLPVIIKEKGFRATLAFIVTRPQSNRVYITPVLLSLWMHTRIPINFTRRSLENLYLEALGQAQNVDGAEHTRLGRLNWIPLIMNGRGGAGQIVNLVNLYM